MKIIGSIDPRQGYRRDESAAPRPDARELMLDFIAKIPRQDQDVVRLRFHQCLRRDDRDMRARQEFILLVRISIRDERNVLRRHAAEVEQRIALRGGAIGRDPFALALRRGEKRQQRVAALRDALG